MTLRLDDTDYLLGRIGKGVDSVAYRLYTLWGDATDAVFKVSTGNRWNRGTGEKPLDQEAMERRIVAREQRLPTPKGWFDPMPDAWDTVTMGRPNLEAELGQFYHENGLPLHSAYRGDHLAYPDHGYRAWLTSRRVDYDWDSDSGVFLVPKDPNMFTLSEYTHGYEMPRDKGLVEEMFKRSDAYGKGMYRDAHMNQFGVVKGKAGDYMVSVDRDLSTYRPNYSDSGGVPGWAAWARYPESIDRPIPSVPTTMSPAPDPVTEPAFSAIGQSAARADVPVMGTTITKAQLISDGRGESKIARLLESKATV